MLTHLGLLSTAKIAEYRSNALTFGVSYSTQAISGIGSNHQARYIRNDKADSTATNGSKITPPGHMSLDFWPEQLRRMTS
jgi:hypothetical protein